jgi:hypothetical protein
MRNFRLIFRPDAVILERATKYGFYHAKELHPDKFDHDAELIDGLFEARKAEQFEQMNGLFDDLRKE